MRRRPIVAGILTAYLVAVALIALWPTHVDADLAPYLFRVLGWLHDHGVPMWVNYTRVEFTANIALFVPLGALGGLLLARRRWWLLIPIGAALSGLVELAQALLLPGRTASGWDVLANTLGVIIGTVAQALIRRRETPP